MVDIVDITSNDLHVVQSNQLAQGLKGVSNHGSKVARIVRGNKDTCKLVHLLRAGHGLLKPVMPACQIKQRDCSFVSIVSGKGMVPAASQDSINPGYGISAHREDFHFERHFNALKMHSQEVRELFEMSRKVTGMWFGAMESQLANLFFSASKIIILDPDTIVRYVRKCHYAYLTLARYMN